jgi:hypothetical protein
LDDGDGEVKVKAAYICFRSGVEKKASSLEESVFLSMAGDATSGWEAPFSPLRLGFCRYMSDIDVKMTGTALPLKKGCEKCQVVIQ